MINAEQIRAARAILDWSTKDLAKQAGLTVNGINKIERGHVNPHTDTIDTLQEIFEKAGIEFLPSSGVRKKERIIEIYEGEGANKILIEDFYNTLRDTGGEILIAHLEEGKATKELGSEYITEQIRKRKDANITHRLLVRGSDPFLIPPLNSYHVLDDEYFTEYPLYIYGPKLALVCWQDPKKVIIINDERFAESVRGLFNFVWDRTEIPRLKKGK